MPPIFETLPHQLGDYTLTSLVGTHADKDIYAATQSHVGRNVLIEVLSPSLTHSHAATFVTTARARVASPLPGVARVYEFMMQDTYWFLIEEKPEGVSLIEFKANKENRFTIQQIGELILQIATLYRDCESNQINTSVFTQDMIFFDHKTSDFTLLSPVQGQAFDEVDKKKQMTHLAAIIRRLPRVAGPIPPRLKLLIEWIENGFEDQILEWESVILEARAIINQLPTNLEYYSAAHQTTPSPRINLLQPERVSYISKIAKRFTVTAAITALISTLFILFAPAFLSPVNENTIQCIYNDEEVELNTKFVSIEEYAIFLDALDKMSTKKRNELNVGIPQEFHNHKPNNWRQIIRAAHNQDTYNKIALSLKHPIIHVNYWDALAYSRWANKTLPPAKLLEKAREATGQDSYIEEWALGLYNAETPSKAYSYFINSDGLMQHDNTPSSRSSSRTFRTTTTPIKSL